MADKKNIDININGDSRSYRTAAGEAKNLTRDLTQEMELAYRAGVHLGDGIKAFAKVATVGMTTAAAATLYMTKQVVDQADSFNDLSKRTGIAIEDLGAWNLVTEKSGTDLNDLALGLKSASKYMVEHEDNLKKLGITGKTANEVVIQLAGIISSLPEDDPRRVALSMEFLGKAASNLLPLLSEGEEGLRKMLERGRELNPITAEFAKQADEVNDQMAELGTVGKGLGVTIASQLLPDILDISKAMTEAAKDGGVLTAVWVGMGGVAAHVLGLDAMSQAKDRLKDVEEELKNIDAILSRNGKRQYTDGDDLTAREKLAVERLRKLSVEAIDLRATINGKDETSRGGRGKFTPKGKVDNSAIDGVLGGNSKKNGSNGGSSIYAQEQKELASLILEIEKAGSVEKTHTQILQEKVDAYAALDPALKAYLNDQIQQINNAELITAHEAAVNQGIENEIDLQNERAAAEQAAADARESAFSDLSEALLKENEDLNVGLITSDKARAAAQMELEHQRHIDRINSLTLEGEEAQELIDQETENYKLRVKDMEQSTKKSTNAAKEFGLVFQSAAEDAVASGAKLSDVLDGIYEDLLRLATRKLVTEPLLEGINGAIDSFSSGSGGSGIFDFFTSFFKNANGNAFDSNGVMAFANGDVFNKTTPFAFGGGQLGVLGEAGPEAILPLKRGSNGQLGVQAGGSGGASVNVVINNNAPVQVQSQQRADSNGNISLEFFIEPVKQSLIRDVNRGGDFAQSLEGQYGLNRAMGASS